MKTAHTKSAIASLLLSIAMLIGALLIPKKAVLATSGNINLDTSLSGTTHRSDLNAPMPTPATNGTPQHSRDMRLGASSWNTAAGPAAPADGVFILRNTGISTTGTDYRFSILFDTNMDPDVLPDPTELFSIKAGGRVGIGVISPNQPLSVNGAIKSTTGGFKFPDATTQTTVGSTMTSGLAMFFNLTNCPTGWTELTAARGFSILGLLTTKGTTQGAAGNTYLVGDVASHYHTINPASTVTGANSAGHTHSVDPPATATNSPGHTHTYGNDNTGVGTGGYPRAGSTLNDATAPTGSGGSDTHAAGQFEHGVLTSGNRSADSTHTIDYGSYSTESEIIADSENFMPYIHFLLCQKD